MKNKTKYAVAILAIIILIFSIMIVIWLLPFMFIKASYNAINTPKELDLLKRAVKFSLLKRQKEYTINFALPALVINQDYDTAIDYIQRLEKHNVANNKHKYFASYAYMKKGDLPNALKYAIESEDENQKTRIYNKMKEERKNGRIN